jgi:hypothetical protein
MSCYFLHKPAKYHGVHAIYITLERKALCSGTTHSVTDCHILNLYVSFSNVKMILPLSFDRIWSKVSSSSISAARYWPVARCLKRNREFQWPAPPLHGSCWTTCVHHRPRHSQTYNIQQHGYPIVHGRNEGLFICAELMLHAPKRWSCLSTQLGNILWRHMGE